LAETGKNNSKRQIKLKISLHIKHLFQGFFKKSLRVGSLSRGTELNKQVLQQGNYTKVSGRVDPKNFFKEQGQIK
jgi:hypothetical protein